MRQDELERRLGHGLKRWAEAGVPALDLEGAVRVRSRAKRRAWLRWLAVPVAACLVALVGAVSFPVWAGAAAGWPMVGPVVTEIILKDAGMAWAYDQGLIRGTVAQAEENGVTVKILGVMADTRRTTVIYQVQGAPAPKEPGKPIPATASSKWARPAPQTDELPRVMIEAVDGQPVSVFFSPPTWTPVGYVGVVHTFSLNSAKAKMDLAVQFHDKQVQLSVEASREETDRFSREVAVNESKEIDGVKVTVEAVIYTPAETIVRTRVEKPQFLGNYSWDAKTDGRHVRSGNQRITYHTLGGGIVGVYWDAFPVTKGPLTYVIPVEPKKVDRNLVWQLERGASQEFMGVKYTIKEVYRSAEEIGWEWAIERTTADVVGVADFELIDELGNAHPFQFQRGGMDSAPSTYQMVMGKLPSNVTIVAVRAKQVGVKVHGPWEFELPQ